MLKSILIGIKSLITKRIGFRLNIGRLFISPKLLKRLKVREKIYEIINIKLYLRLISLILKERMTKPPYSPNKQKVNNK